MVKCSCAACGKYVAAAGAVNCGSCPLSYHKSCVAVPEGTHVSREWSCPDCKRKIRKGDNSCTPVRGTGSLAQDGGSLVSQSTDAPQARAVAGNVEPSFGDIKELLEEVRELRRELAEDRAARAAMSKRIEDMELRMQALESERAAAPTSDKQAELERTVATLKAELNDRDQDALLSDLDIGHLPEEKGENVVHSVLVVASRLGVPLQEQDVVFAERVGAPPAAGGRARRVVLRLARRQLRDDLLRAARVRRAPAPDSARVFINERLTKHNSQLFHRVREECRGHNWKYSWTRRGRIYVRQADGRMAFSIRSEADIARVLGPPQPSAAPPAVL